MREIIIFLTYVTLFIFSTKCGQEVIPGQNCKSPSEMEVFLTARVDNELFSAEFNKITCNYSPPFLVIGGVNEKDPQKAPQILQMRINNFLGQPGVYLFNAERNFASYADNYIGEYFTNATYTGTITIEKATNCFLEGSFQFEAQQANGVGVVRISNGKYKVAINK
ncbi:MAG: DUF6252 family protein [Bacteroidia bacterium]|nr:DUF6252 family protein [Bacteroidia bacterium]MDW8157782.1 DUF6252 family protein [Bacteroidia bacterium]